MWRENDKDGRMNERKICPVMSDSNGQVLCQGRNCYAAYARVLIAETFWFCTIVDSPGPAQNAREKSQSPVPGEHEQ